VCVHHGATDPVVNDVVVVIVVVLRGLNSWLVVILVFDATQSCKISDGCHETGYHNYHNAAVTIYSTPAQCWTFINLLYITIMVIDVVSTYKRSKLITTTDVVSTYKYSKLECFQPITMVKVGPRDTK